MKNGHTKLCQCNECAGRRFNEFVARLEVFESKNHIQPTSPDQTIAVKPFRVRGHFRRNSRHMNGDPALKERVRRYFVNITRPIERPKGGAEQ